MTVTSVPLKRGRRNPLKLLSRQFHRPIFAPAKAYVKF